MNKIEKLLKKMNEENIDGLILMKDANVRYMSGFTGSESYLFISPKGRFFVTDSRYTEQAERECPDFKVVRWGKPYKSVVETFKELVDECGSKRVGFEKNYVTYDMYQNIVKGIENAEIVPVFGLVESLRYIKGDEEIENIKKAAHYADTAFEKILDFIKPGMREIDVALELEYYMRKEGSFAAGFETILVSGVNTSLPHGKPSEKRIEYGDFITMDFGGLYNLYPSDMTRTVVVGKASEEQKKIYNIVKEAQARGVDALKAGVLCCDVDKCVREIIGNAGYGDKFGHGLGHGVGLEIHEEPFLAGNSKKVLEKGCTVTIEPGIYLPNWGGVRIEDTVVITEEGCEILTKSPKDLIEL